MTELLPKDKAALAFIYELDEFKSLVKWCNGKRDTAAEQVLAVDMSQPGSHARIAMLQGQAYAFEFLLKELKNIHKIEMQKEHKV